jgi:hypothetical protein
MTRWRLALVMVPVVRVARTQPPLAAPAGTFLLPPKGA